MKRTFVVLAFIAAALAPFASSPLPASAKTKILVYNRTTERAWITMYKSAIGRQIICAWWAEPKKEMACEPSFGNLDADLWVRAEIVNAQGQHIADIEIFGTPRVMQNVTVIYKDGKYQIVRGAPTF